MPRARPPASIHGRRPRPWLLLAWETRSRPLATAVAAIETPSPDPQPLGSAAPSRGPDGFSRELRAKLKLRDRGALERFYEAYFDRVYGYVRRMLGDDQVAEDVTQDVFLHIQRAIDTYDPERELSPWVFTIATNQVRDYWRSTRRADALDAASLDSEDGRLELAARDPGPLPALQNQELGGLLAAAIQELPESLRSTLLLRCFEGLSFEEIGRLISRNEAAVRKRYSRALADLRERLGRHDASLRKGGGA